MTSIGYQLRKSLDRVGFEADKRLRISRIRAEEDKLKDLADSETYALGKKVLEQVAAGSKVDADLQLIVDKISALQEQIKVKQQEVEAVNAEVWVAPPPPPAPPPAPPAPTTPPATPPTALQDGTQQPSRAAEVAAPEEKCPVCQTPIRANAAFCPSCGYKLQA